MREDLITRQRIDELLRFQPLLGNPGPDTEAKWDEPGPQRSDDAMTLSYTTYPPMVVEFFRLAGQWWWTDPEYDPSDAASMVESDPAIASATLAQIRTMLTFCVRGERFCDGHRESMVQRGRIAAILRRLGQLRDEAPGP